MSDSIHGHDLLHLLMEPAPTPEGWTRSTLAGELAKRYRNPDCRFHTCSMNDLTLNQLLDLLKERGKLIEHSDRRLELLFEKTCIAGNHEHEHDHEHPHHS